MAEKAATPGTAFHGPVYVVDEDLDVQVTIQAGADALPTVVDDDSGGTADTTDFTLAAVTDTSATDQSATINNNFATIAELLDRILQRIQ